MLTVGISRRDKRRRLGLAVLNKSQVVETSSDKYYTADNAVNNSLTNYNPKLLWLISRLSKEMK